MFTALVAVEKGKIMKIETKFNRGGIAWYVDEVGYECVKVKMLNFSVKGIDNTLEIFYDIRWEDDYSTPYRTNEKNLFKTKKEATSVQKARAKVANKRERKWQKERDKDKILEAAQLLKRNGYNVTVAK